jgi:hypothetical protein
MSRLCVVAFVRRSSKWCAIVCGDIVASVAPIFIEESPEDEGGFSGFRDFSCQKRDQIKELIFLN